MKAQRTGFPFALKLGLAYLVFLVMYGLYKAIPVFPLSIPCPTVESNFQHFKGAFFTFLIVDGVEWLMYRRRLPAGQDFWNGRLLAAVLAPWPVFLLWYIAPALYGKFPAIWMEVIYSNVITVLSFLSILILERGFLRMPFTRELKVVLWILLLVSVMLYMIFTFSHLPWADVFVEPQWR